MAAFELLVTTDPIKAGELAQALEVSNNERQLTTRTIQSRAVEKALSEHPDANLIFAADPEFKEGVVGLAAARLVEIYYRPAIVAHLGEEYTRGSCRSIDLQPKLKIENELPLAHLKSEDLKQIITDLGQLQPTGVGNPEPLFCSKNLTVKRSQAVGKEKNHLRLTVSDGKGSLFNGIAFRQGHWADQMPAAVDLVYALEINDYQGQQTIQFNIKDIHPVGG